ncbi:MAG: hypothetical protein UT75_C0013G0009 [Candidatus Yanofskybacteria bacterium GW2011_GWE2_40_11]|uniref:Core domain-containing protein n=1 Tax=Candidatus Yanofskybacteria bacterium GW2011_GWE2_40_11 TaxID=1619033 RepID=A0A0G0TPJ9_9BACT|nr:MAG: hypothetical protein UT75_C0013G0009 [Candidatus Yanofskybacteria bacterium GW2011_GWE2_40_11]
MATLVGEIKGINNPELTIEVTGQAAEEIVKILYKNSARGLRIAVKGGGCSGMEYVIQLENGPHPTDTIFSGQIIIRDHVETYTIVIDPKSSAYVKGLQIDWEISNLSPRLVFKNPNARSSCSCGLSFDPKVKT